MSLGTREYAPKITIFTAPEKPETPFDFADYRDSLIQRITSFLPALFYKHNDAAVGLTPDGSGFYWKEDVLLNMDTVQLVFALTILENGENLRNK